LDFHGLHGDEAIRILERKVQELRAREKDAARLLGIPRKRLCLDVLVGTAHHSYSGKSSLRDAVLEYCRGANMAAFGLKQTDKRGGVIRVVFPL